MKTLIVWLLVATVNPGAANEETGVLAVTDNAAACEQGRVMADDVARVNGITITSKCVQVIVGI